MIQGQIPTPFAVQLQVGWQGHWELCQIKMRCDAYMV